ncbi:hypothetical protein [Palleronia sp.]|uniref:hypothetical protein n=1 Tax=Palleronia sp. TaxID=1940284 RepID=UPI0035C7AAF2
MPDAITTEVLVAFGLIGMSVLVIIGGIAKMRAPKEKQREIDTEAAVQSAPHA